MSGADEEAAALGRLLGAAGGVERAAFRRVLKLAAGALRGRDCREAALRLAGDAGLAEERLGALLAAAHALLRRLPRPPAPGAAPDALRERLRELGLPADAAADVASVASAAPAPAPSAGLPRLVGLRWRVDVAVSTGALARSLQPSVLLQLRLSDGSARRFEVPGARFHELRYGLARLLRDVAELERQCERRLQD
ncbi:COMM domain-containing protein 5 [Suncus etruscus]|uniref:COMM domain-containing protein 5 n=1 Tax=Suncus etruscus TaxID=109475 RepID=UPI00210FF93D|nr:COMM domain-containing protein 5 [Suncus etruscus]